jgi:hypothetical protein
MKLKIYISVLIAIPIYFSSSILNNRISLQLLPFAALMLRGMRNCRNVAAKISLEI